MSKLVAVVIVVGIVAASGAYGRWPINSIEDVLDYLPENEQISRQVHEALTHLDRITSQGTSITRDLFPTASRQYEAFKILVDTNCRDDTAYYLIPIFIRNDFPRFREFLMSHWKLKLKECARSDAIVIAAWRSTRHLEYFQLLDEFFRTALVGSTSRRHDEDYFQKLTQLDLTTSQLKVYNMLEVVKKHAHVLADRDRYSSDPMVQMEAFLQYLGERFIDAWKGRFARINLDQYVRLSYLEPIQEYNREFNILNEIYRACLPLYDEEKRANIMESIKLQYVAQPAVVKKKKKWWSVGSSS